MKACPFCKGRATKLLSISTGLTTCQQCGESYPQQPAQHLVGTLSLLNDLVYQVREIANERTSCGRMHSAASAERKIQAIKERITQASDAVARPASSKARPRLRVAREDQRTRGYAPRTRGW